MQVINQRTNLVIASNVTVATSLSARLVGLLKNKNLTKDSCLILKPCNSIHTFFMRFPIDAAFVDANGRILKIIHSMPPFRLSALYSHAAQVMEFPAGTCKETDTREGDTLVIRDGSYMHN